MTANRTNKPSVTGEDTRSVSVALLTYQRTEELQRAVRSVVEQAGTNRKQGLEPGPDRSTPWRVDEVLIVDNNPDGSARAVADLLESELSGDDRPAIRYVHEPTPGIVAGRNRALDEAGGDVLIFIDDDEVALPGWPHGLLATMARTGAAMVGGPVVNEFIETPPDWVVDGRFFEVDPAPDDSAVRWLSTCNLAIDLGPVRAAGLRFDPRYPHGEDGMFTRLAVHRGLDLRWSATAPVKEFIPPDRTTLEWRLRRQRISTDAWVRTELDLDRSLRSQLTIAARTSVRLVQGALTAIFGAIARNRVVRNRGLALLHQARGGAEGLVGHRAHRRTACVS